MDDAAIFDLLDSLNEAVIFLSSDFLILDLNEAVEKLFRRKRAQIVGQAFSSIFSDIDLPSFLRKKSVDVFVTRLNRKQISWSVLQSFDSKKNPKGFILLGRSLSKLEKSELNPKASQETASSLRKEIVKLNRKLTGQLFDRKKSTLDYVRNIYDYMENIIAVIPGSVYWMDRSCTYLGCNNSMAKLLKLKSRHEMLGKTYEDLYDQKSAAYYRKADLKVMKTGASLTVEEPLYYPDGSKEIYLSSKVPLRNGVGKIVGMLGISIDITERKNALEELSEEKKKAETASKAKSVFIANMSHDFRTPITGIVGMVEDLIRHAEHVQSQLEGVAPSMLSQKDITQTLHDLIALMREDGTILIGATDELLQLTNDILEVVRLESGEMKGASESFDLRQMLQHIKELLGPVARHKSFELSLEINPAVPQFVYGIRTYLDRTLLNLISNALKFTEKGFVKVKAYLEGSEKLPRNKNDEVTLVIEVEDSGVGIPEDKLDSIFDYFSRLTPSYQGLYKGSGLGLYMVKQYVGSLRGEVRVESELGKGTCFILTLPFVVSDHSDRKRVSIRTLSPELVQKKSESMDLASSEGMRVLLVEDNAIAALAVKAALVDLNYVVDVADSGEKALDLFYQSSYDFVFMDVGLPGMSGIEVAKKIRTSDNMRKLSVPIVALTAHVSEQEQKQCYEAGMTAVLNKPASQASLHSVLLQYASQFSGEVLPESADSKLSQGANKNAAVIDREGCLKMHHGNEKRVRDLLKAFSKELKISQTILETAFASNDLTILLKEIHRMLSGVYYMRLPKLERALKAFQGVLRKESKNFQRWGDSYNKLQAAIKSFLEVYESGNF